MKTTIVASRSPVTVIGGGQPGPNDLNEALQLAPMCVAVDGGANLARDAGVEIAALVGDFDSVTPETLSQIPLARQFKLAEQETTDFDKALRSVAAPLIVAVGFSGGRVDHQLAALSSLARHPHQRCLLIAGEQVIFLAPPRLDLPTRAGDVVSIYPLAAVHGESSGLEWPLDGLELSPLGRLGTSNRATGPATLRVDRPAALVMVPRVLIPQVAQSLLQPDAAVWPAPSE
ncbi:thiamine diphosphokinase [Sulfitobacter pontiacus]|mgnify:FL=1|uniref:thiamine diphosphokinase n=1 Tax=Sulfitobacter pontiacus TaxID=60137 RepID=UPI001620D1D2|nr:thiamine diphosphokinase [Sulfitobacter pontiacus]GLO77858.1 thiamine pyrophosphokinase [Sulfitobacter pontiacus]